MDFIDPLKTRAHARRLYLGYFLITVAILLASLLLVYAANGYGLDSKTGRVIQNGLVFIDSHPQANINLTDGDKTYGGQTGSRKILPEGNYTLELTADGYHSWKRTFTLMGGSIERFVYPFLFPDKITEADTQLYASQPVFASASLDRHWLLIQQPGQLLSFEAFDITLKAPTARVVTLPSTLVTNPTAQASFETLEWSSDNRHILVIRTFDGGSEFLIIDQNEPAQSRNLTKLFTTTAFDKIYLRDKQFDSYYLLNTPTGEVRVANSTSLAIGEPILTQVKAMKPHGTDLIEYVTPGTSTEKMLLQIWENGTTFKVRELEPDTSGYLLELATFDGNWYYVAGSSAEGKAYVYKNPLDRLKQKSDSLLFPQLSLKVDAPKFVSFSDNTRFIVLQGSNQFSVRDNETSRNYRYTLPYDLDGAVKATWMDGHRLALNHGDKVQVFDYDGINAQELVATTGNNFFFNRDYDALFTIHESISVSGRSALVRGSLQKEAVAAN